MVIPTHVAVVHRELPDGAMTSVAAADGTSRISAGHTQGVHTHIGCSLAAGDEGMDDWRLQRLYLPRWSVGRAPSRTRIRLRSA